MLLAVACGVLMAGAWLAGSGCENSMADNWQFQNNSSYRVYVAPNGQNWPAATIGVGDTVAVDYNDENIQYIYMPSDKVRAQGGDGRTIHFYNR